MSFYEVSREEIVRVISENFYHVEAEQHSNPIEKEDLLSHLLWMSWEMGEWGDSEEEKIRATCWIGRMYRIMKELGLFTNEDSEQLFRADTGFSLSFP